MQKNADAFFKIIMNKDIKINIDRIFPIDDLPEAPNDAWTTDFLQDLLVLKI